MVIQLTEESDGIKVKSYFNVLNIIKYDSYSRFSRILHSNGHVSYVIESPAEILEKINKEIGYDKGSILRLVRKET